MFLRRSYGYLSALAAPLALTALAGLLGCSLTVSDLDSYSSFDSVEGGGGSGGSGGDAAVPDASVGDGGPPLGDAPALADARCGDGFSLCVELVMFSPHVDENFELVLSRNEVVAAKAVLSPLTLDDGRSAKDRGLSIPITLANAFRTVPADSDTAVHALRFYADHDPPPMDGVYTPPAGPGQTFPDHSWVEEVPEDGVFTFTHGTDFRDLTDDPPSPLEGDLNLTLLGFVENTEELMEIWVIRQAEVEQVVGYYRLQSIPEQRCNPVEDNGCSDTDAGAFTITLSGILDDGQDYRIELYADGNNNRRYDSLDVDDGFVFTEQADRDGITMTFSHSADQTELAAPLELRP